MGEVKNILKTKTFGLSEEDAHLLARYLVEDCDNEYVYCDENN